MKKKRKKKEKEKGDYKNKKGSNVDESYEGIMNNTIRN